MNLSDKVICDIQKIARRLNTNCLSYEEYIENGGMYHFENNEELQNEIGSFSNAVELAGLKIGK